MAAISRTPARQAVSSARSKARCNSTGFDASMSVANASPPPSCNVGLVGIVWRRAVVAKRTAMFIYRSFVERELTRWQAAGWVSDNGAAAIRADLARRASGPGLAAALATLGAVLLGFAAMSFVAANWNVMSKLTRLVLLSAALWASYG